MAYDVDSLLPFLIAFVLRATGSALSLNVLGTGPHNVDI